jgi:hypothetical protein
MRACGRWLLPGWLAVATLLLVNGPAVAAPQGVSQPAAPSPLTAPAWPCHLVIDRVLRRSVETAWERSPAFRSQCERLAGAGVLVLLHTATSVQASRRAESLIGVSADGTTVARVLVRPNADTIELIAHELEHVLEHVDGVKLSSMSGRHRSGVTVEGSAYETDRAIAMGHRVAREVQDAMRTPG